MPARRKRRPVVPDRAISRVDRRGIHGWRVHIKRRGKDHDWLVHDHQEGGRARAYRAARAWHHHALQTLPPPLCTSTRDVRNTSGHVGVSLLRMIRPSGSAYLCYRAVWPLGGGRYKKRAFSIKKLGKRAAFKLAIRARKEGLARLSRKLREGIRNEIARRRASRPR